MQTSKRPIARHRSPVLPKLGNGLGADDVERLPFELRKLRWTSTRISIHCCSMTSANDSKMTPKSASRIASKIAQSSYKGSSEEVHRRYSEVRQLACQKVEARVADSDPRLQLHLSSNSRRFLKTTFPLEPFQAQTCTKTCTKPPFSPAITRVFRSIRRNPKENFFPS